MHNVVNVVNISTDSDSGPLPRGYLHQMSPSVLQMTKQLEILSLSFPDQMLKTLAKIIESPMVGARYHFNNDIYTTINQLQKLPRQTLYRFQLPFSHQHFSSAICSEISFAFLLLDQRLPDILTALCFGGRLSSSLSAIGASASAADSPEDSAKEDSAKKKTCKRLISQRPVN
ncbi:hypothetical protein [Endozoicomonas sp. SCSIO W0465]|uniref:hypothetical protein n=1 Tax=Endozoicomonas sp. SCSIO W0465 TaxID=2918516 RepID=UPI0020754C54|nr:hypothetical protein [Endozoicomonas sp. SCSIO W0465]USE38254.1 hypothetical protein MJO57_08865 [Endozoicomonas sp. SCSIO W0465]